MAGPVRYEAAGAVHHVMARGNGGRTVFERDEDRLAWLDVLERACGRFGWKVDAYALMGNHYHLLLETPERLVRERVREEKGLRSRFSEFSRMSERWD